MKETIAEMLKVEAKAKEIVASAQEEAAGVVRRARQEATAVQDAAERDAQTESTASLEEGLRRARERRGDVLAEIDEQAKQLRDVSQKKVDAAKALILTTLAGR